MASEQTPWKTDRWFTSPWNHDDEVTAEYAFPDEIKIHDVTLRDGEQQSAVMFNADEKIRIAESLADAGVHRIEAGLPAVSPEDEKAVRAIARRDLPSEIYAFSRCMLDDAKLAVDCGVDGVVMEIPSSRHLIELGYRWSVERAVELSVEATRYAHEQGLKVAFFPIDATRAALDDYLDLMEQVATHGHMDTFVLVDTFGVLTPHAVRRFADVTRERLQVPLETHFHMDYSLGVANSLIAAAAGASVLQTTIAGLGERAGNTPMEETVLALLTLYNRDIGIETEKLAEIAAMVGEMSGVQQPSNRPVTGDRLFEIESGIITTWYRNVRDHDVTETVPFLPSLVGKDGPAVVYGKGSGIDSVAEALDQLGLEATTDQGLEILSKMKEAAIAKHGLLELDEIEPIARRVLGE
ncbi:pyruvate carboxyltransferase [Actinobacteria bacterium YIM 96077]|uniref:Pyruvate carboxyltransferase n=1 Tax=Phytoactinopolyspora halophila TaxID=1981511 RepID=A0A329QPI1_9ACTN|nr:pyruvate carboxyltransferase [Phytoactinopolyspora halophila]AYY12291.1 pyruvate carboxyltransferase [Actinobacteria bacterium YIM 96077]RAW13791.1 pyruvate carboxyltransferase [Phytoactinopolyspora halophila]